MTILFVSRARSTSIGNGAAHRGYQIAYDLTRIAGKNRVEILSLPDWQQETHVSRRHPRTHRAVTRFIPAGIRQPINRLLRNPGRFIEDPARLRSGSAFTTRRSLPGDMLAAYRDFLTQASRPVISVIDDPGFSAIAAINRAHAIPTICVPHNLESLDMHVSAGNGRNAFRQVSRDFADEFAMYAACDVRLFISRVETALVNGLGLASRVYPYRPVGDILTQLEQIRKRRADAMPEVGIFVMLGSANHHTTAQSMRWFFDNVRNDTASASRRFIVAGARSDIVLKDYAADITNLTVHGWLEQDALDDLLVRATAVIAPQRQGFGTVTRLAELASAGIPVLTSEHTLYATGPVPGVTALPDDWHLWHEYLTNDAFTFTGAAAETYKDWHESQSCPLSEVIARLAGLPA